MDCYCDYDPPEFWRRSKPKARKPHRCYECGHEIRPGDRYEYTIGKWDGLVYSHHTCERCHDIRQWVQNNVPCLCWLHGSMDDDCRSAVEEAAARAPEEAAGLRFGFARRLHERTLFYRRRAP